MFAALLSALSGAATGTDGFTTRALITMSNIWGWGG